MTPQGVKRLAMVGVVDHADDRFAVGDDRQRQAPGVQAVEETAGAIDGVDYPQHLRVGLAGAALAGKPSSETHSECAVSQKASTLIGHADPSCRSSPLWSTLSFALLIVFKRQLSPCFRQLAGQAVAGL